MWRLGVCLFLLLAGSAGAAAQELSWSSPRPAGARLNAIWGQDECLWAVGDGGAIVRSADRGATWTAIDSGTRHDLLAIWGTPERGLWIVGKAGTVLRSTDGGLRWHRLDAGTAGDLTAVWGSDAHDIYITGDAGQVLRGHDDTRPFQIQRPLGQTDEAFTGVWGSAFDDVYVVGDRGSVLATCDGGRHWEIRRGQTPARLRPVKKQRSSRPVSGNAIHSVTGIGRGQLLVSGVSWIHTRKGSSSGAILGRLIDGGRAWQDVQITPHVSDWPVYRGLLASDGAVYGMSSFGSTTGQSDGLIVSHDGGATFQRRSLFAGTAPHALWRLAEGVLIAVGDSGTILRSLDDGASWQARESHPWGTATLWSVWSDGAREVWAVGDACTVLRSRDGGATFVSHRPCGFEASGKLQSVWASEPDNVYVGGPDLHHFSEGRWTQVTPPEAQATVWRVWGSGTDDVYAAGFEAGLFHSHDQGRTWQMRRPGQDAIPVNELKWRYDGCIFGVFGTGPDDVYLAADLATRFLHSSDRGVTWEVLNSQLQCYSCTGGSVRTDLYSIEAPSSLLGSGVGAQSWRRFTGAPAPRTPFGSIQRRGDDLFILAHNFAPRTLQSAVLRSQDKGTSWQVYSWLPYAALDMALTETHLVVVGVGGLVVRVRLE